MAEKKSDGRGSHNSRLPQPNNVEELATISQMLQAPNARNNVESRIKRSRSAKVEILLEAFHRMGDDKTAIGDFPRSNRHRFPSVRIFYETRRR